MRILRLFSGPLLVGVAAILLLAGGSASNEELLWRHRNLGKALFETPTTVAQSAVELKKALDLVPDSFRDRLNYGLSLLRSGDNKAAILELDTAQKQNPSLPHTWFNLGIAYKREGRYPEAIREFERMAQLDPGEPVSHYNLGLLYNLTDRAPEALQQFEIAAKLDVKLVAPRFQIYNAYRLAGKDEEAAPILPPTPSADAASPAAETADRY